MNEAEINYKMARNKRLHTELTLIKLNFLQQAIELAIDNGSITKKKRVDGPVAYKAKPIPSLQLKKTSSSKADTTTSKLLIEENKTSLSQTAASKSIQQAPAGNHSEKNGSGTKRGLLDTLREKYGEQYHIEEVKEAEALTMNKLSECWMEYAAKLDAQQKHSSANAFRAGRLDIEADNFFTVAVHAITQQKFIEQEKTMVADFMQQAFNNRSINFKVLVTETVKEELPMHLVLNSRQRFERIAAQYPLVRELKSRLNLELDY